ncbi:transcriptional regulator, TetR family [Arboricoccus pini]|uniref:Transcriptional regulator, TetR family n=1 Tax=Arboricoccus pini TaxID=1963835 RepID=A0A212RX53_9PROT|nr:TetR family transcriptional regulator [Arboricoccus pini]SNB77337.1 transcriptional regulator, TetR family [Arboricoccus pini]
MAFTQRSAESRARILWQARRHFAEHGYEGATIRNIARDAGIDPSMVMRYYGSKEGLLAAAASFDLRIPDLTKLPRDQIGMTIASHFVAKWEGSDHNDTMTVLLRASTTNEHARMRMHELFRTQVLAAFRPICPPDELMERAGFLCSQILGVAITRYVLKLPQITSLPVDRLLVQIAYMAQHCLVDSLPEKAPPEIVANLVEGKDSFKEARLWA